MRQSQETIIIREFIQCSAELYKPDIGRKCKIFTQSNAVSPAKNTRLHHKPKIKEANEHTEAFTGNPVPKTKE